MSDTARHDAPGRAVASEWSGILREFATIVAGVVVALAGQAWWSAREDRSREAAYLRQLWVDTRENARRLDQAIGRETEVRSAQGALATAIYAPRPLPSADSLRTLLDGPVFAGASFDPVLGTYTALLTTGDLRLIETDSLRAELVAYVALLEHDRDLQQFYFAQAFGDPGRMAKSIPGFARTFAKLTPEESRVVAAREAPELARLRDDADVRAALFALQVSNGNRLGNLKIQRRATDSLRVLLEAEPSVAAVARGGARTPASDSTAPAPR